MQKCRFCIFLHIFCIIICKKYAKNIWGWRFCGPKILLTLFFTLPKFKIAPEKLMVGRCWKTIPFLLGLYIFRVCVKLPGSNVLIIYHYLILPWRTSAHLSSKAYRCFRTQCYRICFTNSPSFPNVPAILPCHLWDPPTALFSCTCHDGKNYL